MHVSRGTRQSHHIDVVTLKSNTFQCALPELTVTKKHHGAETFPHSAAES